MSNKKLSGGEIAGISIGAFTVASVLIFSFQKISEQLQGNSRQKESLNEAYKDIKKQEDKPKYPVFFRTDAGLGKYGRDNPGIPTIHNLIDETVSAARGIEKNEKMKEITDYLNSLSNEEKKSVIEIQDNTAYNLTPLSFAAANGEIDVCELLIKEGAKVNNPTDSSNGIRIFKPLYMAANGGWIDIVNLLLGYGADANALNDKNKTALLAASANGYYKVVETLIDLGKANVNQKDVNGNSPLYYASYYDNGKVVEALLKRGADVTIENNDNNTPIRIASEKGYINVVKLLLENIITKKQTVQNDALNLINTPLCKSLINQHSDVAKLLISAGSDTNIPTRDNNTPLCIAIDKNLDREIIQLLISKGANTNSQCRLGNPLSLAVEKGNNELVELLLQNRGDVNLKSDYGDYTGSTPLHIAAEKGYDIVGKTLIDAGANINMRDDDVRKTNGRTPIYMASLNNKGKGSVTLLKLLISKGANLDMADSSERTPLMIAIETRDDTKPATEKCLNTINALIAAGANVNINMTNRYYPPLMSSVLQPNNNEIVRALTRSPNINFNIQDEDGRTALDWAIRNPSDRKINIETLKLLLDPRANLELQNSNGLTPLMLTLSYINDENFNVRSPRNEMYREIIFELIKAGAEFPPEGSISAEKMEYLKKVKLSLGHSLLLGPESVTTGFRDLNNPENDVPHGIDIGSSGLQVEHELGPDELRALKEYSGLGGKKKSNKKNTTKKMKI